MAAQLTIGASSSTSAAVSPKKYDVFISFRGEDTRRSFTSHLYDALSKKVLTFIDDSELKKGDVISSALVKAIEDSYASIVIFSKDYASSKWCLNELVKILEYKKDHGHIVIHHMLESVFIKVIVEDVLKNIHGRHPFEVNKELVGIENKNEKIESLLKIGSNDVRILALWGMGGIGKTTLAKSLYAKHCSQFEHHCFLENVRELSASCGLDVVRKNLLSTLLELRLDAPYVEAPIFLRKLACERNLIVLDDVSTLEQAENLNMVNKHLGPGSRVVVTTRDRQICSQFNECTIYVVEGLNMDDSFHLFCLNAFREKRPEVGYGDLSRRAISYCSSNPLALKVLGASLRTKSKGEWKSELDKLKKIPNRRILDVLKLSFDDLDATQQDIFLDIACFLDSGLPIYRNYLTVLLNACNFFAVSGIKVLLDKALITLLPNDNIQMHDLLVEMGREIVKQESPKDPGRRSRLWDLEEVYDVLKCNKGTEVVEVIILSATYTEDLYLSSDFLESMISLRILHITQRMFQNGAKCRKVHLPEGLEWLSNKLRHLYWESFPLESLPSTFCAERLVQLNMSHSKLKKLWDGIQKLDNLMFIILDESEDLIEIPDLSRAPNLQKLSLSSCLSLRQLHPSIFTAPKLRELHLTGCKNIESLKTNIHSKSLQTLCLLYCSSLVEFSVTSEEMTWLSLHGTAIHELPSSMWRNSKLTYLSLSGCEKLNFVWKRLSNVTGYGSLVELNLSECTQINNLNIQFILDGARSLKELNLNRCYNLEALPDNIQNCLMLERLDLDDCINLKSLPKLPASLLKLTAMNCTYLVTNSIQREMLENKLHRLRINNYKHSLYDLGDFSFLPGSQVLCEFDFHITEASIVIPPIPKDGLYYFVFCIILSEGLDLRYDSLRCTSKYGKQVHQWNITISDRVEYVILISDHVLLICLSDIYKLEKRSGGDQYNYNLSFKFERQDIVEYESGDLSVEWSTKGIKGCGVIPIYPLESSSSSKVEIVELQSSDQVSDESDQHLKFDIDELQHRAIGVEVKDSTNGNEDDQQLFIPPKEKEDDLKDKSCGCSTGLLLKHLLEESKRLFLFVSQANR